MKRIRVPEGMLKAAIAGAGFEGYCADDQNSIREALEAALLWLSEHPQVPTDEQYSKLRSDLTDENGMVPLFPEMFAEWQRRCFVQEESEIPEEEIKDLLIPVGLNFSTTEGSNQRILEAYRRGLRKGVQK